jgi:hypothetical protein
MGLLDDAIREHLDLKRRHGADPAEIERAEQEALGPVRRGPQEPDDLPIQPVAVGDEGLEHQGEEQLDWDESAHGDAVAESPFADDAAASHEESASARRAGHDDEEQIPTEEHEPASAPAHPPEHRDEETAEYSVGPEEEFDKRREDVLEETPEFLEDTPDHDRLWFEQRPPRDFDFDG